MTCFSTQRPQKNQFIKNILKNLHVIDTHLIKIICFDKQCTKVTTKASYSIGEVTQESVRAISW